MLRERVLHRASTFVFPADGGFSLWALNVPHHDAFHYLGRGGSPRHQLLPATGLGRAVVHAVGCWGVGSSARDSTCA